MNDTKQWYTILEKNTRFDELTGEPRTHKTLWIAQGSQKLFVAVEQDMKLATLAAAAPAMLEALLNLENDDGSIPAHIWQLVQSSIQKAKGE